MSTKKTATRATTMGVSGYVVVEKTQTSQNGQHTNNGKPPKR